MADFNVRSDVVNVEQIMEQIRARIREKRGVDYTEQEIRELASVKLEKFLDPRGVRSDLLQQFRRAQAPYAPPELPNYVFEDQTLFESTRGPLRFVRRLLLPILKLFFNPNPLIQALNIQSKLNASAAEREAKRDAARAAFDQLHYEVMHNLVLETTRLGIEVKNLKMKLESLSSRLEFSERRARALESVVVYKPAPEERERPPRRERQERPERQERQDRRTDEPRRDERRDEPRRNEQSRQAPPPPPAATEAEQPEAAAADPGTGTQAVPEGPGQKSRRRRRRRGRRGSGSAGAALAAGTDGETAQDGLSDGGDEPDTDGPDDAAAGHQAAGDARKTALPADARAARPEPFEHTFGAQTHPVEPAASDPAHRPSPVAEPRSDVTSAAEPSVDAPAATPEQ